MLKDMVAVEKFQFVHQITEIRDGLIHRGVLVEGVGDYVGYSQLPWYVGNYVLNVGRTEPGTSCVVLSAGYFALRNRHSALSTRREVSQEIKPARMTGCSSEPARHL